MVMIQPQGRYLITRILHAGSTLHTSPPENERLEECD